MNVMSTEREINPPALIRQKQSHSHLLSTPVNGKNYQIGAHLCLMVVLYGA
jgi:hypothetical protein